MFIDYGVDASFTYSLSSSEATFFRFLWQKKQKIIGDSLALLLFILGFRCCYTVVL